MQGLYLYVWAGYFICRNIYSLIFNFEINFNSGFFVRFIKFPLNPLRADFRFFGGFSFFSKILDFRNFSFTTLRAA